MEFTSVIHRTCKIKILFNKKFYTCGKAFPIIFVYLLILMERNKNTNATNFVCKCYLLCSLGRI